MEGKHPSKEGVWNGKGDSPEKGVPYVSVFCHLCTKAGWTEAKGEGKALVMLHRGSSSLWGLLGGGSDEVLGEKQFWQSQE